MSHRGHIVITGATGFVGGHVLDMLGDYPVTVLARRNTPELERRENVTVWPGDVTDAGALRGMMKESDIVIHLAAVIEESGTTTFDSVIRQGTEHLVAEAKRASVERFIHMSTLGVADDPRFPYLHAKWQAEQAVINSGLAYTIFRPSVIFGPRDGFISTLADVVRGFPVIPVVGDGLVSFQPIHVSEVAACVAKAVDDPVATSKMIFELGGGKIYTYEEIINTVSDALGVSKRVIHVPVPLMQLAVRLSQPLPRRLRPPVTLDQLAMLDQENITSDSATRKLLGVAPRALENNLDYLRHG